MKTPFVLKKPRKGFALVVTVSMMVLLTIVVVATLSLSTVTLRSVDRESAQAVARANARLAMIMAIGQLQKEAGPDRRITATAEMQSDPQNPQWTGVWYTDSANLSKKPVWLVSGDPNTIDPAETLNDQNSAVLAMQPTSDSTRKELRAKYVNVEGRMDGRFAYWVGDEGSKAKVNIVRPDPKKETLTDQERLARATSPEEPGLSMMDSDNKAAWSPFTATMDSNGYINRDSLASLSTISLALDDSEKLPREDVHNYYFNDLTTGGFGLPVNVKDGGMKADLSVVFDRGSQGKDFVKNFLGATPSAQTIFNTSDYKFAVTDKTKFGLSEKITSGYAAGFVGPNWGSLYSYGRMWEKVTNGQAPLVGLHPLLDTDLRQDTWKPYSESGKGAANAQDIQHMNSSLTPVVSMLQIGYYLGAELGPPGPPPLRERRYWAKLMIKPIVALWNPYNVTISPSEYMVEWAMAPYLRFDYQKPNANGTFDNGSRNVTELWMREYWKVNSNGMLPTDTSKQGGSYLRVRTSTKVDFEPGEIRLFSVAANPVMDDGWKNTLVPTLETMGAYKTQIIRSENGKAVGTPAVTPADQMAGQPLYIPGGYYGWFGDVFLQDTHWDENTATYTGPAGKGTFAKFASKGGLSRTASATWFTFKAIDKTSPSAAPGLSTHLSRFSNIWNGGQDGKAKGSGFIPEPIYTMRDKVRSNAEDSANTRKAYLVDTMAEGQLGHIGTWRFYLRNPTELTDASQGLRGWIDSNPRVPAGNLKFDGSNNTGTKQGWNMASNLIGGASTKNFGDKAGGNRGLVAEGTWETSQRIPEGEINAQGRWQGYGGPSSTAEGGQHHVIVYDIPRSPLTSVGQLQHAQLSRYNFEPGFVVGNSYANPRIPADQTVKSGFATGFNLVDISYEVNNRLWDSVFFSTISPDYVGKTGNFDDALSLVISGTKELPNPRMVLNPLTGDSSGQKKISLDKVLGDAQLNAPQAIASRVLINGAFNVNSTSKTAWKALLSTMGSNEIPWYDMASKQTKWTDPKGIRFNRFSQSIVDYGTDGKSADAAFWQGWRTLDEGDLDKLAEAIVKQVKERGPFRSMADFVNRNPSASKADHKLKGALQAALDEVANNSLPAEIGKPAGSPSGTNFPTGGVIKNENQAAGHAGYLLQGDVLQSLAPVMQVRSDYFQIRTCGEALDKSGKVIAKAWCEAFVQRMPEYVDPSEKPEISFANLSKDVNKEFGRRFQLVSFRWLTASEI